jgi:ornithine cyclodeaminase
MLVLQIDDIKKIIEKIGFKKLFLKSIAAIEEDYKAWNDFDKVPRVATHVDGGVIELMPVSNKYLYSFKYVNGHPKNPKSNKLTVMATGQLSKVDTGEPLMFCEMTLLTAIRTAATSALAAKYLAKKDSKVLAFIGNGAQSEFQYLAFSYLFNISEIRHYDIDIKAMEKMAKNLSKYDVKLTACKDTSEAVLGADIITTMTADKKYQTILTKQMIKQSVFINAIGGDCPGKTELEHELVLSSKVVVEFLEQSKIEGEIQHMPKNYSCPELYEVVNKNIDLNVKKDGTIIFDSVGFALQDYSILRVIYELAKSLEVGQDLNLIPNLKDVKDLYSLLE